MSECPRCGDRFNHEPVLGRPHSCPGPDRETVKRPDLFGTVHETYQTESELNGWRASQGRML